MFMLREFDTAETKFKASVEAKDVQSFIQLKHKLLSTLTTLGYSELMQLLEDVCKSLASRDKKGFESELESIRFHFRILRSSFTDKLQELTQEQVM